MKEYYIQASGYPNYEVSNLGNVRNKKTGTVRQPVKRKGYQKIRINNRDVAIHRLVADSFYDGDHKEFQVNHIDGNKSNNFIGNLEFVTGSENVKHAYDTGLKRPSGGLPPIPILDESTGKNYKSLQECARDIGGTRQGILYAVNRYKSYKGHKIIKCEASS